MISIDRYIFSVFLFILKIQQNGLLDKPKQFKIHKEDKKLLKIIYTTYKLYKLKITQKQFNDMVIEYMFNTQQDIIKSADECAKELEKIIK